MIKSYPSKDELHSLFYYSDGKLYSKITRGYGESTIRPDDCVCKERLSGYPYITINKVDYYHSVCVWIYHFGPIESGVEVDHKNRIHNDDKIENLRLITRPGNQLNRRPRGNAIINGVRFDHNNLKKPYIVSYKNKYMGSFDNVFDAVCRRKTLENQFFQEEVVHFGI